MEKLKTRAQKAYQFICSLSPNDISDNSEAWNNEPVLYPKVTEEQFQKYARNKIEGTLGQQSKAYQMLCSIKSFKGRTRCK